MTTMISKTVTRSSAASEVWDLTTARAPYGRCASVRQLTATSLPAAQCAMDLEDALEPKRESRDNILLGAMMAVALLVGSLFGGAFGGADTPVVSDVVNASMSPSR